MPEREQYHNQNVDDQGQAAGREPSGTGPELNANTAGPGNSGPLSGVRVIELGTLLAGPFAGRMLADFGAEVIKVEPPGRGDPLRDWGRNQYQGRTLWWPIQSRNKKLVTLDLRRPEGQELLKKLVAKADVLIENFRPGTLERWGLGWDDLSVVNPGLIMARISGYGQTGPYSQRAGFASVGEAMGGLRYINGYPDQPPPRMGISLGDSLTAMFATQGILMALYWRDTIGQGRGQVIDASIVESCFAMLESSVPEYDKLGIIRQPSGTRLDRIAPSNIYKSRDGKWMVIAANNDNLFRRLCRAMEQPELADDPRFVDHRGRGEHQDELDRIIGDWAARHDAADIDRILNEAGVVCGPIYNIADIMADPHFREREMIIEMEDPEIGPLAAPGIVPKLSATPGSANWTGAWTLGAHNEEIYSGLLGLPAAELARLQEAGII